ncbi:unnamed protein product [Paramecium pentaurelia]|uniref:Uncharacterized protein n=1 Tax=Paramecium pentaurelia TaxID=43138 RepID=A0A8S1UVA6_9CILI|nr:unnamed protein product [Paramecium pentaurelia]
MQFHLRHSYFIENFLSQFSVDKQNQVVEYLINMGIDLANKIGTRNTKELYQQLKQLSKNIKEQTQGDIKNEIKTIQKQLRDLNDLIQISQRENQNIQGTHKKQKQSKQIDSNRYQQYEQYEHNDVQPKNYQNQHQNYNTQRSQSKSPIQYNDRTPHKYMHSRSHSQRNLTPKITESPPPPQIVYINNMHNKFDIKSQFDDRQIKKLMYGDSKKKDRGRYINKGPSPQQIVYSSQTSGGLSYRQYPGQVIHHQMDKQKQNTSPKKLPVYLQNVESKIKPLVDQDKLQYREIQKDRGSHNKQEGTVKQFNNNSLQQQNSGETDTFFDIQQYIQDQKKYQFSPVQEMNDDVRNEDDDVSDTFSNFSPPNEEVKEFFQQQQYRQQRR